MRALAAKSTSSGLRLCSVIEIPSLFLCHDLTDQRTAFCVQEDWSLFMANKRRFTRLKMTEFDEEFSDEMAEDILVS